MKRNRAPDRFVGLGVRVFGRFLFSWWELLWGDRGGVKGLRRMTDELKLRRTTGVIAARLERAMADRRRNMVVSLELGVGSR